MPMGCGIYAANFAQTVQSLPGVENHLPPDANHFVLQLLLIATLVVTAAAALRVGKKHLVNYRER